MGKDNLRDIVKENLIEISYAGTGKTGKPFTTEINNKIKHFGKHNDENNQSTNRKTR